MPSCEEAACCNVEVVKGAGGALDTTLELTFCTCIPKTGMRAGGCGVSAQLLCAPTLLVL